MRRSASFIITLSILSMLLVPTRAAATKITFGVLCSPSASEVEWIKQKAIEFQTETGIEVEVTWTTDWQNKTPVMLATGTMPDAAWLGPDTFLAAAESGAFMDLRPFLARDKELNIAALAPPAWTGFTLPDGTIWGVSQYLWGVILAYNADFISQAGLPDPNSYSASEWNQEVFREYVRKLTIDTDGDGKPNQYGLVVPPSINRYGNLIVNAGGHWVDRTIDPTMVTLDTPEAKAGLGYLH
jgi:ABC-type glycerol-3-phosphate transport system substrate-binding protein